MLPRGVHRVMARGKTYYYYQPNRGTARQGERVALPRDPQDPQFWSALRNAKGGAKEGTFSALIVDYRASYNYKRLRPASRRDYDHYLELVEQAWGGLGVATVRPKHIAALRDKFSDRPVAANHCLSIIRTLLKFGVVAGYRDNNPARDVPPLNIDGEGATPWPEWAYELVRTRATPELQRFVYLARHSGQRTGDVCRFRGNDLKDGGLAVTISKLRDAKHWVPLTKSAQAEIESWRVQDLDYYLKSATGQPYNADRLRAHWGRWLKSPEAAPIRECGERIALHGLRAMAVIDRRMMGLAHQQIAAQLRMSIPMVERYSRFADRVELAKSGMERMER